MYENDCTSACRQRVVRCLQSIESLATLVCIVGLALWLSQSRLTADDSLNDLERGKRLFQGQCARCHGIEGKGGTGANLALPKLKHAANDADLFSVIKGGIPGTAMPGNWFLREPEVRDVVRYVRSLGRTAAEPLPGDPGKGKRIYEKSECAKCHIVRGKGGNSGPVLTGIGARRGLDFLRQAVLHPDKNKPLDAQGYTAYLVVVAVTRAGRVITGSRVNEDTFTIQIRDEKNQIHSLRKQDLETLKKTDTSLMPGYDKKLSRRDIDHLISYLAGLRGTP